MLKRYLLIALFLVTGSGFAQQLSYNEFIELLNMADTVVKVDDFLISRGFEYFTGDYKDSVKSYSYNTPLTDDYSVGVNYTGETVALSVFEISNSLERWKYFKGIAKDSGIRLKVRRLKKTELWLLLTKISTI